MQQERNFDNNVARSISSKNDVLRVICHKAMHILFWGTICLAGNPIYASQLDISDKSSSSLYIYPDNKELTEKIAKDLGMKTDSDNATVLPKGSESSKELIFPSDDYHNDTTLPVDGKYSDNSQNIRKNKEHRFNFVQTPSQHEYKDFLIKPVDFGQDYIGVARLSEYESYWQDRIQSLDLSNKCRYFVGESSFTVYGSECIQLNSFDRLEAYSDNEGLLSALLFNEKLKSSDYHNEILRVLRLRYEEINPANTPIKDVSNLNNDLCAVMTRLAKASYRCDVKWYQHNNIYISYTFSMFKGSAKATILYASEKYLLEIEKSLLKRRLALVRQELDRNLTLHNGRISMTASK